MNIPDCFMECSSAGIGPGHVKTCLMPHANNKGADQPAHPRSTFIVADQPAHPRSTFIVRCLDSMMCILAISKVQDSS